MAGAGTFGAGAFGAGAVGAGWARMLLPLALVAGAACTRDAVAPVPRTGANAPALRPSEQRADRVEIDKSERRMRLLRDGRVIASYRIDLGDAPQGHKRHRGDERTPEGEYRISERNRNSLPSVAARVLPQRRRPPVGARHGLDPGGDIMIHGGSSAWWREDWTDGCAAVSDAEIEEIWSRVPVGTPIRIDP